MMEIVAPLRIQTIATRLLRQDEPRVVQVTLGNQVEWPFELLRLSLRCLFQLLKKRNGGKIANGMDGVQAQAIQVKIPLPIKCILDKKPAHFIAPGAVK